MPDDQHLPDDEPHDMGEPGREPEPPASTPGGTQLPAVPEPPTGASESLKYILSVVHDPKHRQAIEQFAFEYGDKREDHMLTQAGAMATAILETHIDRAKRVEGGIAALYGEIAKQAGAMADAGALLDLDTLRAAFRAEATDLAHDAFRGGFRTGLFVGAGGIIVGLLIALIIHIL